jgi:hypothetical protein
MLIVFFSKVLLLHYTYLFMSVEIKTRHIVRIVELFFQ